jgi:hypothetical protein
MEVAPEFDPITGHVVAIHPRWAGEPRKLFEKHQDFPAQDKPLEENLAILERGGVRIRNGDYYIYKVVWDFLEVAFANLNLIPGVSVPSDPRNLRARKGFLKTAIEITKLIYQCSNQRQIIGGEVTSIAIGEQGILTG